MKQKQRGQSGLFKTVALSAIIAAGFTVLTAFALPDRETVEHITATIPEEIARIAEGTREKLEPVPETESKTETEQEATAPETEPAEVTQPETVEEMIYRYCAAYGVDYNLALAIARLETGHFTSAAYVNGAPRLRHSSLESRPLSPMQKAMSTEGSKMSYRESTVRTSASEPAMTAILAIPPSWYRHFSTMDFNFSRVPVPEKSWYDLIMTVPFSLAAIATLFTICLGASNSTSTYLAPAIMAFMSLSSLTLAAAASVKDGSASIREDSLHVATKGTSIEKHS